MRGRRELEQTPGLIDPQVADSDVSLITEQVRSGLVVRMAVLYDLLAGGPIDVARGLEVA